MPIFEERESLGVKTLKSFADIKKELVMFTIVKYGMDLKVIFPYRTVTGLWSIMAISMKRWGWCSLASYLSVQYSTEA